MRTRNLAADGCGIRRVQSLVRLVAAAIAGTIASGTLHAEDPPLTISPLRVEPDRNAVNIATGKTSPEALVLSVPGSSRLRFDRIQNATPYIKGQLHSNPSSEQDPYGLWTLHTADGMSESFNCGWADGGKTCESITGSGSSLTYSGFYFRKAGSGERYVLNLVHLITNPPPSDPNQQKLRQYYASRIEYPDGEIISFTHDTAQLPGDTYQRTFYRPNRISTNLGYYITISYLNNDLTQPGWCTPYIVSLYGASDPYSPLASLPNYGNGTVSDIPRLL